MRPVRILLVEDNPGDADLIREALEEGRRPVELSVVVDGEEAINYLFRRANYADVMRPDLVLLDLNLPKMDGRDVLAAVKRDERLRIVPIVVLTTSDAERDILQSYTLGANCYVTKPLDLKAFQAHVKSMRELWFTVAKLP